jgi:hypothetical protein
LGLYVVYKAPCRYCYFVGVRTKTAAIIRTTNMGGALWATINLRSASRHRIRFAGLIPAGAIGLLLRFLCTISKLTIVRLWLSERVRKTHKDTDNFLVTCMHDRLNNTRKLSAVFVRFFSKAAIAASLRVVVQPAGLHGGWHPLVARSYWVSSFSVRLVDVCVGLAPQLPSW